jgi:hypothetical protein
MKFSLRSLLIVMLLGGPACGFGWQAWKAWKLSRRPSCGGSLRQIGIALHNYFDSAPGPTP